MDATRRVFLTAGIAGVPGAMLLQQLQAQGPAQSADDNRFINALGQEVARQIKAAQADAPLGEIAHAFTATLRLHAAYLRQRDGDAAMRKMIRDAKANGHWEHALERAGDPEARLEAIEQCQRRFGIDLQQLSPAPRRQTTREDMERFAAAMLGGASFASQLEQLATLIDDSSARLPGNLKVGLEQSYDEWCQSGLCQIVWVLEQVWGAACSVAFFLGEAGAIACATAFVEYEMARFFAWLVGCYC